MFLAQSILSHIFSCDFQTLCCKSGIKNVHWDLWNWPLIKCKFIQQCQSFLLDCDVKKKLKKMLRMISLVVRLCSRLVNVEKKTFYFNRGMVSPSPAFCLKVLKNVDDHMFKNQDRVRNGGVDVHASDMQRASKNQYLKH